LILEHAQLDQKLKRQLDASDIVQQTLLRAHAALPGLRDRSQEIWRQTRLVRPTGDSRHPFPNCSGHIGRTRGRVFYYSLWSRPMWRTRVRFAASDRVALGRCRPEAPTDPYVLALEHTVLQIMGSLRV
jgi:hypothetical protein